VAGGREARGPGPVHRGHHAVGGCAPWHAVCHRLCAGPGSSRGTWSVCATTCFRLAVRQQMSFRLLWSLVACRAAGRRKRRSSWRTWAALLATARTPTTFCASHRVYVDGIVVRMPSSSACVRFGSMWKHNWLTLRPLTGVGVLRPYNVRAHGHEQYPGAVVPVPSWPPRRGLRGRVQGWQLATAPAMACRGGGGGCCDTHADRADCPGSGEAGPGAEGEARCVPHTSR